MSADVDFLDMVVTRNNVVLKVSVQQEISRKPQRHEVTKKSPLAIVVALVTAMAANGTTSKTLRFYCLGIFAPWW